MRMGVTSFLLAILSSDTLARRITCENPPESEYILNLLNHVIPIRAILLVFVLLFRSLKLFF